MGSMARRWPLWLAAPALAVGVITVGTLAFKALATGPNSQAFSKRAGYLCLGISGVIWLALFSHNLRWLPAEIGFDAHDHLEYIETLEQHWALPLPNQGMQMFQPPLYYVLGAMVIAAFNLTIHEPAAIILLRLFHLAIAIGHFSVVFFSLRLIFPRKPVLPLVGLGLAAFLPMHLYMAHYITNETFAGLLVSAAVFLCLKILRSSMDKSKAFILLGLVLGAAILTKFTAVLAVPCLLGALLIGLRTRGER